MHAGMYAELVLLSPCTEHTWQFIIYLLFSVTYVSLLLKPLNAEDLSLHPFVAGSLHASAFRAEFTELTARSCGASIGPDICMCTTAAAATTHCQRALTRC